MHSIRWTSRKIAARLSLLEPAIYRIRRPIAPFRFHEGPQPLTGLDVNDTDWPTINPGTEWGQSRQEFTLRTTFSVPARWQPPIALYLPLGTTRSMEALAFLYGPEALAFLDGEEAYQGVGPNHQEILLPERFLDGKSHLLALHGWTGIKDERYKMGQPCVVQVDQPTRDFVASARVALETAERLPEDDPIRWRLLNALDSAFLLLDLREPWGESFYESVREAHLVLREGISKAGPPMDLTVAAVGHAHIDVAWLWPLSQTRKKVARTFSTVLRLMELFPEFCFTQSQPQLYQYVSQDHPEIMARIKERVAEGRWETIGGMWVEADCNITGAESLVRQFVLGRRYFLEQFGQPESPVLWLPDVFGYAWQLPQLIRRAGLSYFVTAKLSWNQYNRIPYDCFWWQGLDGTKVLTYFITTSKPGWWGATYSAELRPAELISTWEGCQQKEICDGMLIAFGHGDGGGGPTRAMLENSREMSDHPGLPRVRQSSVKAFLNRLESEVGHSLPTWNGELYLELHRGTYTSQARNKRANRKSEFLLHDAEFVAAWASVRGSYSHPRIELRRAWELLCLNQFHDILPGSSIAQVYEESARDYAEIQRIGEQVREDALAVLDEFLPREAKLAVYNPTCFPRSEIVEIPGEWVGDRTVVSLADGNPLPMQRTDHGVLAEVPTVPSYGYVALGLSAGTPSAVESRLHAAPATEALCHAPEGAAAEGNIVLENALIRAEFDRAGDLVRLLDKRVDREVLAPGQKANQWQAFEDRPLDWDAWDIDVYYDEKQWLADPAESIKVKENGPLRATLEIRRRVLNSDIVQRVHLYRGDARLDFDTWIDWRERHILLKVAFPVNVLSPRATYEIQWGNVERPTHRNTSWDWARFESCAHKWVDLSEGDYGVSLLNDCKYGHDIRDNVIRLTALRGAAFPDPTADLGEHVFTYSLLPHTGDWRNAAAPAAYALNDPLIIHRVQGNPQGTVQAASGSLVHTDSQHVVVETVKRAEDDNGLIVRLYEYERTRGRVQLGAGFSVDDAFWCNLLEKNEGRLSVVDNGVDLEVSPYEIVTLRLVPSGEESGRIQSASQEVSHQS